MVTQNWVNIGSGNGLLPDVTKPLPGPIISEVCGIHLGALAQEMLEISILDMSLKISHLDYSHNSQGPMI